MWWPKPYLPKFMLHGPLWLRILLCRLYWNPMWNMKKFCERWITVNGFFDCIAMWSMQYLVWIDIRRFEKKGLVAIGERIAMKFLVWNDLRNKKKGMTWKRKK